MFLTLILIALFPLSAAEQNEINPKNEEKLSERQRVFFLRGLILWRRVSVIAKGNYGQTEGVFLCLLSFARAKKVRRQPAATGNTAICGKALSLQYSRGL
jgi:hypothetical protein